MSNNSCFTSCLYFTCGAHFVHKCLNFSWPWISLFNCLCADVWPSQIRTRHWVWLPPFPSRSPNLQWNNPCIPFSGAISEEMELSANWPSPPSPAYPQPHPNQPVSISSSPRPTLCFNSVNNQAVALSVPGPNWTQCQWWLWWMDEGWSQGAGCLLSDRYSMLQNNWMKRWWPAK